MPRRDWIEQRLLNWARWRAGGGAAGNLGYAAVKWAGGAKGGRDGYREAVIPTSDVEASETDDAVNRLHPGGLRLAVYACYCGRGAEAERARELGIAVSTMYRRVEQAHDQLAEHFLAHQDRQRAERERVARAIEDARQGSFTP
jgi:hypothetical protein